jgi:hypothetical protein
MPVYVLAGPAVALIGIISVFFVMRRRAVDKRSMYSSRRSQIERKVRAARQRTLVPHGRGDKAPAAQDAGATGTSATPASPFQVPAYQAPAYEPQPPVPQQAWEMGASPAAQAPAPPVYEPPPSAPPSAPVEPGGPAAEPVWTPAPAEPVWTPAPAPDMNSGAPPAAEPTVERAPAEPLTPAGGGASWSIVGAEVPASAERAPAKEKEKDKKKDKQAEGNAWQLASGAPAGTEDAEDEGPRRPSAAMALAQYAVLVVGLVMVLIGVLVMVANSKVT